MGVLLQALGLAELRHGNDVAGVVILEESVRYVHSHEGGLDDGSACADSVHDVAEKMAMMTDRFRRARVLRWKAVTDARRRAIHSFSPGECGARFRQVRLACRRRVANRNI